MNNVPQGLTGILIVLQTKEEHFHKLNQVFTRLVSAGLKVRLEKCRFLQEKVIYLGHQMDSQGLRTVQSRVKVKLGAYAEAARGLGAHLSDIGP